MTNDLIRGSFMAASLVALTACATPYPTRYVPGTPGLGASPALSPECRAALGRSSATAGGADNLAACFIQRAGAWEERARNNRSATRTTGVLAIIATATGIGLAAEGDPNHAIVPLGLLTGAAVTGARSYASPEQATVAEKAVAAYNCLLSAVADLRKGDNMPAIQAAHDQLAAELSSADIRPAGVTRLRAAIAQAPDRIRALKATVENRAVKAQVEAVATDAQALAARADAAAKTIETARASLRARRTKLEVAYQQAISQTNKADARLLHQSDIIDAVATAEITKREPTIYAVASSAHDSILAVAGATGLKAASLKGPGEAARMPGEKARTVPEACRAGQNPQSCAIRNEAEAATQELERLAEEATAQLAAVDAQATIFDQAVAASKATDPDIGADCKVVVTDVPVFAVSATTLTLSEARTGSVVLTGGVAPYYPEQPPKGWSVILSPSGRAEIAAPEGASGPETLSFYDAAPVRNHVSVAVTPPEPKKTPPAGKDGATEGGEGGAKTSTSTGGPGGTK